jgi:hypothetical protein
VFLQTGDVCEGFHTRGWLLIDWSRHSGRTRAISRAGFTRALESRPAPDQLPSARCEHRHRVRHRTPDNALGIAIVGIIHAGDQRRLFEFEPADYVTAGASRLTSRAVMLIFCGG